MAVETGRLAVQCATFAAVVMVLSAGSSFVAAPGKAFKEQTRTTGLRGRAAAPVPSRPQSEASAAPAALIVGSWGVAAMAATVASKNRLARRADGNNEKKEGETKPFDVFDPNTYGNLSMDDVKKYGTAGTVAYVLTELAFWAVAVPAECATFYYTAGRWPDFDSDVDKAAVFGFVFAASNLARLCLPLRFGAALAMAPWVDENIMQRFGSSESKTS